MKWSLRSFVSVKFTVHIKHTDFIEVQSQFSIGKLKLVHCSKYSRLWVIIFFFQWCPSNKLGNGKRWVILQMIQVFKYIWCSDRWCTFCSQHSSAMSIVIPSVHKNTNSTPLTQIKEFKQELISPDLPMLVHSMHSLGL